MSFIRLRSFLWVGLSLCLLIGAARAEPFQTKPAELLARLDEFRKLQQEDSGVAPAQPISAEALEFLTQIDPANKLDQNAMADAYLIASGVYDVKQRETYRKRLDEITAAAHKAIEPAKTSAERGDALLRFLHKGPMAKGYNEKQTSLSELLDTGKFNCVSATVMYHIVGERLGFKLVAVSVPGTSFSAGHALSMFVDGDRRIDVETTNPKGFDFQARLKESGGVVIGIVVDASKGHDVSDLGLASLIAQNRAKALSDDKRPADAMQAALVGLALDPVENAEANNFMAAVNGWALDLAKREKFEPSLKVIEFGLALKNEHSGLVNNRKIVWNDYAQAELKAGRERQAIDVLRRAEKAVPDGRFTQMQAELFIHQALDLTKQGKWNDAIALMGRGHDLVDEAAREELRNWTVQIYLRQADDHGKTKGIDGELAVYVSAWPKWSEHRDLRSSVAHFAQESLAKLVQEKGPAKAAEHLARLRKEFSGLDELNDEGQACAERAIHKLLSARKYAEAAAAISTFAPLVENEEGTSKLIEVVYDAWARDLARKEPEKALATYAEGLKAAPQSSLLSNNAVVVWDQLAKGPMSQKKWAEAIAVYERALMQFPDNSHVKHNLAYCQEQLARSK